MDECEVFKKTIDILNTDGWNQGKYYQEDKGYCLVGALYKASGYHDFADGGGSTYSDEYSDVFSNAYNKLANYVNMAYRLFPVSFNDSDSRTKEDVIKVLEEACTP